MNIFNNRKGYQDTYYPMLYSSIVEVDDIRVCLHCGEDAKYGRDWVETYHGGTFLNGGYRCTCKDALKEMASRVAYDILNKSDVIYPNATNIPDCTAELLLSNITLKKALLLCNPINPIIVHGSANSAEFLTYANKVLNYKPDTHPMYEFMKVVTAQLDRLREEWEFYVKVHEMDWDRITKIDWIVESKK